jgi:hypothetical protein
VVSGRASDPTNFDPTEMPVADDESSGTVFVADDAAKYVNRITADSARPRITATFALFLTSNPDVKIRFDGADLDPVSAERHRADYPLTDFAKDDQDSPLAGRECLDRHAVAAGHANARAGGIPGQQQRRVDPELGQSPRQPQGGQLSTTRFKHTDDPNNAHHRPGPRSLHGHHRA